MKSMLVSALDEVRMSTFCNLGLSRFPVRSGRLGRLLHCPRLHGFLLN